MNNQSQSKLQVDLGKGISFHILLVPLLLAAYFGNYMDLFLLSWVSALLHESAHFWAAKRLGIPVSRLILMPFGACIRLKQPIIKNPAHEILLALAGPMVNLFFILLCMAVQFYRPFPYLSYIIATNLAMFLLNLLPCLPLDGGRILRSILTLHTNAFTAWKVTLFISRILSALLFLLGIWGFLAAPFQFSLLLIGAFLLGNLCSEEKGISRQTLQDLLYCDSKPESGQLLSARTLVATASTPARRLLRQLSYHNYHVIQVLDQDRHILCHLTETEILSGLLTHGIRATLGDLSK